MKRANDWQLIEPVQSKNLGHRTVVTKNFKLPDSDRIVEFNTYWPVGYASAGVIAVTESNQVVVARQYRQGPEKIMEELPGGVVEPGEDVQTAALRELREETCYEPAKTEYLGVSSRDAYGNGKWHYFLATGCRQIHSEQATDEFEDIEVKLITIAELIENAKTDNMTDPVAVLLAYDKLKELEAKHDKSN